MRLDTTLGPILTVIIEIHHCGAIFLINHSPPMTQGATWHRSGDLRYGLFLGAWSVYSGSNRAFTTLPMATGGGYTPNLTLQWGFAAAKPAMLK